MIIFTHIEKTAGTTFKTLLRSNYGIFCVETNKTKKYPYTSDDLAFARKSFFRIRALAGHNLSNPAENLGVEDAFLVTFLRDPVVRCASHYQDLVLRSRLSMSFKEWIALEKNQNQMVRSLAGITDLGTAKRLLAETYDFVGFTERFEESLKQLNLLLDRPLSLQYRNVKYAVSDHIKQELLRDKTTLNLLKQHNQLDRQLYDFALEEIYLPRLQSLKKRLDSVRLETGRMDLRHRIRHRSSIAFNKFVYRQLIKIRHA